MVTNKHDYSISPLLNVLSGVNVDLSSILSGQGALQTAILSGQGAMQTAILSGQGALQTAILSGQGALQTAILSGQGSLQTAILSGQALSLLGVLSGQGTLLSAINGLGSISTDIAVSLTQYMSGIVGSPGSTLGVPSINVGMRVQGHKCTVLNAETTLFVTSSPGFCFVQAHNDPSATENAIVRVYAGSIVDENLIAYAEIPAGLSQIVACYPAYSNNGFVITADADGSNPVCVSAGIYAPVPYSSTDYQTGEDTYGWEFSPNTNYGSGASFQVGNSTSTYEMHAFLKFDLSTVVPGSLVTQATLSLTISGGSAGNMSDFQLRQLLVDFIEAEATWNDRTTGVAWGAPGGLEGTDYGAEVLFNATISGGAGTVITMDVTPMVKAWVDGTQPNYGFFIMDAVPAAAVNKYFYSLQAGTPSLRPTLSISVV